MYINVHYVHINFQSLYNRNTPEVITEGGQWCWTRFEDEEKIYIHSPINTNPRKKNI